MDKLKPPIQTVLWWVLGTVIPESRANIASKETLDGWPASILPLLQNTDSSKLTRVILAWEQQMQCSQPAVNQLRLIMPLLQQLQTNLCQNAASSVLLGILCGVAVTCSEVKVLQTWTTWPGKLANVGLAFVSNAWACLAKASNLILGTVEFMFRKVRTNTSNIRKVQIDG